MCSKLRSAATALASPSALASGALLAGALILAAPALASTPAGAPAAAQVQAAGQAKTASKPASADERAAADRLGPLAQAAFWSNELTKNPADAEAGVKLAGTLRQLGKAQEAYNTVQQVLALSPDNVEALLESARDAISGQQGFYAVAPAKRALQLKPRDWRAASLLGIAYEQTRQPDLALAAHQQALALAPDNPMVLCNLGMFLAGAGDRAQAESLLRKAAAQPGATPQIRLDLALILGLEGKLAESERLQRGDLPPDAADNNMAYLRAATGAQAPTAGPSAAALPPAQGGDSDRSWNALAKAQAQDQVPIN
ncbi:MAG TPA: pilus assembly protein TadD [Caulobacteraceae bacterium]|nr:pilus assembly protein TadD [Caulobacteraceae bacterium]